MLKNQTVRGGTVETLFQNLSLIKKYIDRQKVSFPGSLRVWRHLLPQELMSVFFSQERCGEERRRTRQFLDYLQEFLGVLSTEWTMED